MTKISEIIGYLDSFAPPIYQESYDNSGLLTGDRNWEVTGVLLTLDCIEVVVQEAIDKGCNLIVAHHPIIFGGLKSITGKNYVEKTIIKAIKNDIAIYACHTNLDHVKGGVSFHMAKKLGLKNVKVLQPKSNSLLKLETYCPKSDTQKVLKALSDAGAGAIGEYSGCSFSSEGIGRFTPSENANPSIGSKNQAEEVKEDKIEVLLPIALKSKVLRTLQLSHPYEEVAYFLHTIENQNQDIGSGVVGELEEETDVFEFFDSLKKNLGANTVKYTNPKKSLVKKIALCGGSGSFLLKNAKYAGADVFVSSDFKYHEFFDAENELVIADIGHYETESHTKELFYEILKEKFTNIALVFTETYTNPVNYY